MDREKFGTPHRSAKEIQAGKQKQTTGGHQKGKFDGKNAGKNAGINAGKNAGKNATNSGVNNKQSSTTRKKKAIRNVHKSKAN